jgi:hypothetical protein
MEAASIVVGLIGAITSSSDIHQAASALLSDRRLGGGADRSQHQHIQRLGELRDLLNTVAGAFPDGQRRDVDSQVRTLVRDIQEQTGELQDLLSNFAGACPGGRRRPVGFKIHTSVRDLEQAEKRQTGPFESVISQEIRLQKEGRHRGMTRLRLVRSLAGVSLLYPVCMLVMSNYAVTKGLLRGCSRLELHPLGVSLG